MSGRYPTLPSLTSGRALAALLVAGHHASSAWSTLVTLQNIGWLGVTYFYILSGFVLTWSFDSEQSDYQFWTNRIARIFPLHWVCLSISLLSFFLLNDSLAGPTTTPWGTLANVLLMQDWLPGRFDVRQSWNGVAWSLSAEFFFYLFAPVLIRRARSLPNRTLVNIMLGLYIAHLVTAVFFGYQKLELLLYSPLSRIPEFIYGIGACILVQRGLRTNRGIAFGTIFFVPLLLYYCTAYKALNFILLVDLAVPPFLAMIVLGALRDVRGGQNQNSWGELMNRIGNASFSLYMTHALLLGAIILLLRNYQVVINSHLLVVAFLVMSIPVALISHRLVELPGQRWLKSLLQKRSKATS